MYEKQNAEFERARMVNSPLLFAQYNAWAKCQFIGVIGSLKEHFTNEIIKTE